MNGRVFALAFLVMLASCSGYELQSVFVEPRESELFVGDTLNLRAVAMYTSGLDAEGSGRDVADRAAWSSGNSAIATVDRGRVIAIEAGVTTVTARFDGQGGNDATIRITPAIDSVHVVVVNPQPTAGDTVVLNVRTVDASGVEVSGIPLNVFNAASINHFIPAYSTRKRSPNTLRFFPPAAGDYTLGVENIHSVSSRVLKTYVSITVRPKP